MKAEKTLLVFACETPRSAALSDFWTERPVPLRGAVLAAAALAWLAVFSAVPARAELRSVEAEGLGPSLERAREAAQVQAVEICAGGFLAQMEPPPASELVAERILANAASYVVSSEILAEGPLGEAWRANVRFEVDAGRLREDIARLQALRPGRDLPLVAVAGEESVDGESSPMRMAASAIEERLSAAGVEIVDERAFADARARDARTAKETLRDPETSAALAARPIFGVRLAFRAQARAHENPKGGYLARGSFRLAAPGASEPLGQFHGSARGATAAEALRELGRRAANETLQRLARLGEEGSALELSVADAGEGFAARLKAALERMPEVESASFEMAGQDAAFQVKTTLESHDLAWKLSSEFGAELEILGVAAFRVEAGRAAASALAGASTILPPAKTPSDL